jgi:hypothetical protein
MDNGIGSGQRATLQYVVNDRFDPLSAKSFGTLRFAGGGQNPIATLPKGGSHPGAQVATAHDQDGCHANS